MQTYNEIVYGVKQYRVTDEQGIILFASNVESNCQTFMDKYADLCEECYLWLDKFDTKTKQFVNVSEMSKVTFGMASNTITPEY